jgi:hypothetical protein
LSLRLLVDEDTEAKVLVSTLRKAGLTALPDELVINTATELTRILLTRNCDHFRAFHETNPTHQGILAIYEDRGQKKNMTYAQIVQAIANREASGVLLGGEFIVLNNWNY